MSRYEIQLERLLQLSGLPMPVRQFKFAAPLRDYRIDFAWPDHKLLVEVDGGAFVGRGGAGALMSRLSPVGYHQGVPDYRKRNLANLLGYTLLAYQPEQVSSGEAMTEIRLALQGGIHLDDTFLEQHVRGLAAREALKRKGKTWRLKRRGGRPPRVKP